MAYCRDCGVKIDYANCTKELISGAYLCPSCWKRTAKKLNKGAEYDDVFKNKE